ncbi:MULTISPECIES: protein translocase subunit SecDF [Sphingobacterium]|uniref:Multifunctional fusion protein n=1 Tax=Sphingobacterium paramultivorum TaxID=2886510 RepID=A0A7G5E9Y0_9SPHI|nr:MULTISPECIES: protein translocase subunit SecDF [Sphingobacterium]MBB1644901.1 protein translocase subunit SecDF [Sphingobacterium sp. UME9]MCS4167302.1 SecD/SecF fusion protein [Sphingobacterium sp. BIGb0116]QMV70805.1 protein translocase subunit SecDF [Sphingobacterium paramultivorum]WET71885.1 MAG: protein translocase subunit SecDF [Sphingobacterium sp.]WSO14683.1 protein translocase subunit SecDF [Sphingobacterium paramultivorum]
MQGKGLIKLLVIVVSLACLYSLSFTWVTRNVERDAENFAKGDLAKEKSYLDSMAGEVVYNLGFAKYTYREAKANELALGLDLKGGMNVTMEISLDELIRNLANNPKDEKFNKALEQAVVKSKTSAKTVVALFMEEYKSIGATTPLSTFFSTKDNAALIKPGDSDSKVESFLQKEADNAIQNSYKVLRTRIDKFGVASPNIQIQQGTNRILIELPGVKDESRVRNLLQGSAKLEFYETYTNQEVYPILENIDKTLASTLKAAPAATTNAAADTSKKSDDLLSNLTGGKKDAKKDSAAVNLGQKNPLFEVLRPAVYMGENQQMALMPGSMVGIASLKDTAKVNAYLQRPEVKSILPGNLKLLWAVKPEQKTPEQLSLYAIKGSGQDNGAVLTGDVVTDATANFDEKNQPVVGMQMNSEGAHQWKKITAKAAQNRDAIAIVLDNVVYSAPSVNGEIPNGSSSISGSFTVEDTKDLANVLKAGRLPTTAKIVEEAVVGPTLGQAAIDAGVNSAVIGIIVVMIFMIAYYNTAGIVANIAVLLNVFIIMGVLASLNAVLTLPGIAGIVLTMGTAVDANVLIYERIREELGLGKSIRQAVADGYKHALPSILDSQITTFLIGIILFLFGSGPILGFATTLMVGIITSLFTAILVTRVIFEWMLAKDFKIKVSFPWSANTLHNANFKFVQKRKIFYAISIVAVLISAASIFTKGFSLGVDFQGGRTYTVRYDKPVDLEAVRTNLDDIFKKTTEVKVFGAANQLRITTTYHIEETSDTADKEVLDKLNQGLSKVDASNKHEILSSQKVGPSIATDIKSRATSSAIFSIIIVAAYILIRFHKWEYSVGAAIATIHDAIILLGLFSILDGIVPFSLDIDQHFVAAILTVIAYSVNDTVVVFDRLREFVSKPNAHNEDLGDVVNHAINSTLSRTIITSLTIVFVLAVLFIFGGEVIRGFSFAILIGVIVGTYSSIILAAPSVYDLRKGKHLAEGNTAKKAEVVRP